MSSKTLILILAMLSIPGGLSAAEDPFEGTWVLNLVKSKYVGRQPPPDNIYTYIPYGKDGGLKVHGTIDGVSYIRTETMDGKPFPYTANPAYDQGTRTRPDLHTIKGTYFMKGKTLTTMDRVVSKDGLTIISRVHGTKPTGEKYEEYRVFDKVVPGPSAAKDPFAGTWVLNIAKSKFNPGPPPKGLIYTYIPVGKDGALKVHGGIEGHGAYIRTETMDGKPFPYTANPAYDQGTRTRPDLYTIKGTYLMKGKVLTTMDRVVSKDGKTIISTVRGKTPAGESYEDYRVFDKVE
jgi:hypothetical protein